MTTVASVSPWFAPTGNVVNSERAAKSEQFAPVVENWEKQAMVEWLQDAAVGSVAPVTSRKPLPTHTVKMSGADLADFEADRRQQVLHDRIAELRRRAR